MTPCDRPHRSDSTGRALVLGITALLIALSVLAAVPSASAQEVKPAAQDAASTLTPVEAQHALEVLQDPAKRDAAIETLQTIAKVAAPAAAESTSPAAESTSPAAQPAAPAAPLVIADGFGAELLLEVSTEMGDLSAQFEHSVRAVTKFPVFWRWLTETATDPDAQALLLGFLWRGLTVAVLALLAERLVGFGLRRPLAALEARAAHDKRGEAGAIFDADRAETV